MLTTDLFPHQSNFELFMVTTSSTSAIPSFANVDFSKNFHQISLLRSLKLYDAPLARSYDIILKHVHSAPALAYGGDVNEAMRACAMQAYELDLMKDEAYIAKRRLLESYLHNMKIPDLKKVSLQLCLHIAAVVKGDPVARAGLTFQSALEVVLNRYGGVRL